MNRIRLSLAGLMSTVAVVALGLVSLRSSSSFWTTAASTVTLGMLLTAIVGAIFLRGPDRAFWVGFAIFGWAYLLLVNWDWIGGPLGHDLTSGLSAAAEVVLPEEKPPPQVALVPPPQAAPVPTLPPAMTGPGLAPTPVPGLNWPPSAGLDYWERVQQRSVRLGHFVEIGRLSLSLIFALVGGLTTRAFAERTETARADVPPDPRGSR